MALRRDGVSLMDWVDALLISIAALLALYLVLRRLGVTLDELMEEIW